MYVYIVASRIPYGMRGLKFGDLLEFRGHLTAHPIRDAWIEIDMRRTASNHAPVASHTGCVD